jgi:hypothetical protein
VHPKTRNSATESALLAKGSLDFEFAYRNPYFTHVSRTSLCNRREREREKIKFARVTLAKKKKKSRERERLWKKNILHPNSLLKVARVVAFRVRNEKVFARQRDRSRRGFISALREIQYHICLRLCVFLFSLSFLFFFFFLCVFFARSKKIFLSSLLSFVCFFGHVGVEFLRNFRNPPKHKKKRASKTLQKTSAHYEVYK